MASITKNDRTSLYARAQSMQRAAMELDDFADQFMESGMVEIANGHRALSSALREHADDCRRWGDGADPS